MKSVPFQSTFSLTGTLLVDPRGVIDRRSSADRDGFMSPWMRLAHGCSLVR